MKRILIVSNHMNVGGIQKALLELLKALAKRSDYEVSLFCCKRSGAFLEKIPSEITVLPENPYALMSEQALSQCKRQGFKYFFLRALFALWSKWFTKALPSKILCRLVGKIGSSYDVAISYSQPIADRNFCNLTNEIVLNCVRAPKKITFVHCDFASYGGNSACNRRLYRKFDAIAAVSDSVRKQFCNILPELSDKTLTVRNCCDQDEILALANTNAVSYTRTAFVTVARLSEEKGLLRCVPIFAALKSEGFSFEWHIVGGGPLEDILRDEIARYSLEKSVFLEGEQLNPYRFMRYADFFFLPSFHEAAPVVFDEAYALNVPILATKTLSAIEMVEARGIGLVCENSTEDICAMLRRVLTEKLSFSFSPASQNETCIAQFNALCD